MSRKLACIDLSFRYEKTFILDQLSLHVNEGEFVSLIGPSGSGKSTLFYLIGGLYQPEHGDIQLDGKSIIGKRGHIGYIPQQASLLPWRTVEENVRLGQEIDGKIDEELVTHLLARADLLEVAKSYPHELSGGMQQRVAFIRALAGQRSLLCLDEPFASLDALTRTQMQRWLLEILKAEKKTVLLITHSIEEALLLSDRIYVLSTKPMKVIDEVKVPYKREERMKQISSKDFLTLRKKLEDQLFHACSHH